MTGRPRGRPRKNPIAPSAVVEMKAVIKEEFEDPSEMQSLDTSRRSSPRKRKPPNFDGYVVEAPGVGVIGEEAEIIKELDAVDLDEDVKPVVDRYDLADHVYKPGPQPTAKKRGRPRKTSAAMDTELIQMEDIDDDVDDPMRRVERRGRKKKKPDDHSIPRPYNSVAAAQRRLARLAARESGDKSNGEAESAQTEPQPPNCSPRNEENAEDGDAEGSMKDSIALIQQTPTCNDGGTSRRKQKITREEESSEDDLVEEDLVDVETYDPMPIPKHGGHGTMAMARIPHKPFRCADCGACYRREAYLLNHLAAVHQDECAILSAAERSAKRAEKRPPKDVQRERPGEAAFKFGCDLCVRRFLRWEGLIVHQKQMHKEITEAAKEQEKNRDYGAKCPVCLLYFFGNHALSEHVAKEHPNHNRFIFACDICGMGFMHWARVRAHKTAIHHVPVKYTQGYLKNNPEMARVVEAQRMRRAVERNRAKRMLERGLVPDFTEGGFAGLSNNEANEYEYLMPPQLEPEERGEVYEVEEEEIVEEEGIIDAHEMMNIRMVPFRPLAVRRQPLPPRMIGYRDSYRGYSIGRGQHQLSALHRRVMQLDRGDLEILNRGHQHELEGYKIDVDDDLDVEVEEQTIEEMVVDDMVMEEVVEEVEGGEEEEEEIVEEVETEVVEGEEVEEAEEVMEEVDVPEELPPQLDMYA